MRRERLVKLKKKFHPSDRTFIWIDSTQL